MKVVIPAAGVGSRLRPLTYTVPKVLLPVAGKPILGHILDQVISWGGEEITLVVGYLNEQIKDYVSENYDLDITFREQKEMLGLGHAVLTGLEPEDEELLVILGDTILGTDLKPVIARGVTSIGVKEVPDPRNMGVVLKDKDRVVRLIEKPLEPPTNLAIVGVYYIRDAKLLYKAIQEIIKRNVTVKGEFQITDALQLLIDWGEPFETFPVEGWYDCGRPETIVDTNRYLFDHKIIPSGNYQTKGSIIIPPVSIGDGTVIENSIVGPYISIGKKGFISDTVIKNCILGDNVSIRKALLEDSLFGNRAEINGRFRTLSIGASTIIDL
jgi:glucose-1-phosphate thymidylyltransferase